jgi:S-adenosylmethionine:tRNA ribosyltransferase-isomerase
MLASDFDYHLPPELIAQYPIEPRDHSRLMHLRRTADSAAGDVSHHHFYDLPSLLKRGDLLIFNDTRVLRARLRGWKILPDGEQGAKLEALLLREIDTDTWEALLRPSARLRAGTLLRFVSLDEKVSIDARPVQRTEQGWVVRFEAPLRPILSYLGEVPLPPYITASAEEERYQTIYAADKGALESAAAPTAGLHFTREVFDILRQRDIETAFVTLQIGIGTFRPIQAENLEEHIMHEEHYEISAECARRISQQKARGGRVIAVGTTAVRVLESAAAEDGDISEGAGPTSLFIRPGYRFRVVDGLITNFHLPRSTLLVMISAFAGIEEVRYAYTQAVQERYRFFSFGDAMFIE